MTDKLEKYKRQMWNARRRDIHWSISFEDWCEVWGDNWENRGRGPGQLVMARKGDTGGYTKENVEIQTSSQNGFTRWNREDRDPFERVNRSHLPDAEQAWYIPGWKWDSEFNLIRA